MCLQAEQGSEQDKDFDKMYLMLLFKHAWTLQQPL